MPLILKLFLDGTRLGEYYTVPVNSTGPFIVLYPKYFLPVLILLRQHEPLNGWEWLE